jgi:hypothetical protein
VANLTLLYGGYVNFTLTGSAAVTNATKQPRAGEYGFDGAVRIKADSRINAFSPPNHASPYLLNADSLFVEGGALLDTGFMVVKAAKIVDIATSVGTAALVTGVVAVAAQAV